MKRKLLTVKELAAEQRMSAKSIQRTFRKGEIPVHWLNHISDGNTGRMHQNLALRPAGEG